MALKVEIEVAIEVEWVIMTEVVVVIEAAEVEVVVDLVVAVALVVILEEEEGEGEVVLPPEDQNTESLFQVGLFIVGNYRCILISSLEILTLNAPIATKVICFSRLLKCLRSLYGKQCGPRSDCSNRSSLFWVHAVCFYTQFVGNVRQLFAADDFSRLHFQIHFFLAL